MQRKIDLLALGYPLDKLCEDNDIEASMVIKWMVDEGLLTLQDYFDDEEDEEFS